MDPTASEAKQIDTNEAATALVASLKPSFCWQYCWSADDDFYFQKLYVAWDNVGINFYNDDCKELIRRLKWREIVRMAQLQVNNLGFTLYTIYGEEKYISELVNNHVVMMKAVPQLLDFFHCVSERVQEQPHENSTIYGPRNETANIVSDDSLCIQSLPADVIKVVFSHLPNLEDVFNVCCVCRHWYKMLPGDNSFMMFWKKIFMKTFPEHQVGVSMPWKTLLQTRLKLEKTRETLTTQICEHGLNVERSFLNFQTWKVNVAVWSGKWYYEVKVGPNMYELQIGWLGLGCKAKPFGMGTGVGDDEHSYCWDPVRKVTFWNEIKKDLGKDTTQCKENDIVGCGIDLEANAITWYFNGKKVGTYNDIDVTLPVYAGWTLYNTEGASVAVAVKTADFAFPVPEGYKPLAESIHEQALLVESIVNRSTYQQLYFKYTENLADQLASLKERTWIHSHVDSMENESTN